jgi:hypothetical protein
MVVKHGWLRCIHDTTATPSLDTWPLDLLTFMQDKGDKANSYTVLRRILGTSCVPKQTKHDDVSPAPGKTSPAVSMHVSAAAGSLMCACEHQRWRPSVSILLTVIPAWPPAGSNPGLLSHVRDISERLA